MMTPDNIVRELIAHQRRMEIARRLLKAYLRGVKVPSRSTKTGQMLWAVPASAR